MGSFRQQDHRPVGSDQAAFAFIHVDSFASLPSCSVPLAVRLPAYRSSVFPEMAEDKSAMTEPC
jgi:hypothetical protein